MIHTDGTPTIANAPRLDLPDILITAEGSSLFLVAGTSKAGRDWLDDHVDPDATRWGRAIVVEHRYIEALFDGMVDDGLVVR